MKQTEPKPEPKLNEKVRDALAWLMTPMSSPVTHGEYNKRMFLEAFIAKAGEGVAIEVDDIIEHGALTDREFKAILKHYLDEGVIVKKDNLFGAKMYKLNLTT